MNVLLYRRKNPKKILWLIFLVSILGSLLVFIVRYCSDEVGVKYTDGQVIQDSSVYTMGSIYDRNNELLVTGTSTGVKWKDSEIGNAFSNLLGVDLTETLNSQFTIVGHSPWLYGNGEDRLTLEGLVNPGSKRIGGDIKLTMDHNLQNHIATVIKEQKYKNASVVVSNWHSGEIMATYGDIQQTLVHPGSAIKPILVAAILSIHPELRTHTYDCTESNHDFKTDTGYFHINCAGGEHHGHMSMEEALAESCNGYFISLIQQVGKRELSQELKKWGFDTTIAFSDFRYYDHRFLNDSASDSDYLLAAIGQANATIAPIGMNNCVNTILNHGILKEPVFLQSVAYTHEDKLQIVKNRKEYTICNSQIADDVVNMMLGVGINGTGKSFYYPNFACKTGTAQKTLANDNGEATYTVWTTGGLVDKRYPYSITVCLDDVLENVSSADAGGIAREVIEFMMGGNEYEY